MRFETLSTAKNVLYAILASLTFAFVILLAMSVQPSYGAEVANHHPQPAPQSAPAKDSSNDGALIVGFVLVSVGLAIYLDRERKQKVALQIDRTPTAPIAVVKFEQRF